MPVGPSYHPFRTAILAVAMAGTPVVVTWAQEPNGFENLQVLPKDIPRRELFDAMLGNIRGLGLPRLQGQGCLFCHVGSMAQPRDQWDYASDKKYTKRKARIMMAMVRAINGEYLAQLPDRIDSTMRVTCATCHAGRTDPRPLPDVLVSAYDAGGIDSTIARYQALRARYFGADAYDFRVGALEEVALGLADRGALDDAILLASVEREVYPDSAAAVRAWARLRLERTLVRGRVKTMLAEADRMISDLGAVVARPSFLNELAWRLYRRDRRPEAIAIMRHNRDLFPDEYEPAESIAFILRATGDQAGAERILEDWLQRHPDHVRARRLLLNMRDE